MSISITEIVASNQAKIDKIDALKNTPVTGTKQYLIFGGATISAVAVGSLLLTGIIQGIIALSLIGVTGLILVGGGYAIKQANPVIQQKIRNAAINAMYKEARDNALAQLETYRIYQYTALQTSTEGQIKLNATLRTIRQKINNVPADSTAAASLQEIYTQVEKAHKSLLEQTASAQVAYEKTCKLIEEKALLKDISDIAMEAMSVLGTNQQDELQKMLSLESLKQIDNTFNLAMAQIDSINVNTLGVIHEN